jgi:hypothetical protein
MWLPRGETLDRPFVEALVAWVRGGGTLIVTDPAAVTRAPDGSPLADLREVLIGPAVVPASGTSITVAAGSLTPSQPPRALTVPLAAGTTGAFPSVPVGASVVATNADGSPAGILRPVGSGQVLAFAGEVMFPKTLDAPGDLVELARALLAWRGLPTGVPAWRYEIPGNPQPSRLPWATAVRPPAP